MTASSNSDGATVTLQTCTGAASQAFSFTNSNGNVVVHGNKCLDVPNGSTADGVKLQIWTCSNNGNANQNFYYTVSLSVDALYALAEAHISRMTTTSPGPITVNAWISPMAISPTEIRYVRDPVSFRTFSE